MWLHLSHGHMYNWLARTTKANGTKSCTTGFAGSTRGFWTQKTAPTLQLFVRVSTPSGNSCRKDRFALVLLFISFYGSLPLRFRMRFLLLASSTLFVELLVLVPQAFQRVCKLCSLPPSLLHHCHGSFWCILRGSGDAAEQPCLGSNCSCVYGVYIHTSFCYGKLVRSFDRITTVTLALPCLAVGCFKFEKWTIICFTIFSMSMPGRLPALRSLRRLASPLRRSWVGIDWCKPGNGISCFPWWNLRSCATLLGSSFAWCFDEDKDPSGRWQGAKHSRHQARKTYRQQEPSSGGRARASRSQGNGTWSPLQTCDHRWWADHSLEHPVPMDDSGGTRGRGRLAFADAAQSTSQRKRKWQMPSKR